MKARSIVLLLALAGLGWRPQANAELPASLSTMIPAPVRIEPKDGHFELTARTALVASAGAEAEAQSLAAALNGPTRFSLGTTRRDPATQTIEITLDSALASALGPEGYHLSVTPRRVVIRAASPTGLFYGGVTFRQLLPPEIFTPSTTRTASGATLNRTPDQSLRKPAQPISWIAPCVEIDDYPRFVWRGLLLDVARHYLPGDFIKKFVDVMALHKLNTLQLHLTDDQGWRIEIKKHPRLTEIGAVRLESPKRGDRAQGDGTPYGPFFYTQDQIRDLVAYAQARHVTLVPEIEMPGHFLAGLAAYPQFSCRGGPFQVRTRWGIEPDILCPGNEETFRFVQDILSEVAAVFPSRFIHIGGDEAPRERWKHCAKCQARLRAEGLRNEAELQTYFNRRIENFLAGQGRRLIGWDETLEGGLTPGAAVMSWRGMAGGLAAANAGHDVVMSPTSHCYFDYAQARGPGEPESIGGFLPLRTVHAFEPAPAALAGPQRARILGAQGNIWTEYIGTPQDVEYFAFPRAVALAEIAWSPAPGRRFEDFCQRLEVHCQRLDSLKVNYRKLDAASRGAE